MATILRTAADVRSYALGNWRELVPDLLVANTACNGTAPEDDRLVEIGIQRRRARTAVWCWYRWLPVSHAWFVGLLPRLRELGRRPPDTCRRFAGAAHECQGSAKVCRKAGAGYIDCCGNAYLRLQRGRGADHRQAQQVPRARSVRGRCSTTRRRSRCACCWNDPGSSSPRARSPSAASLIDRLGVADPAAAPRRGLCRAPARRRHAPRRSSTPDGGVARPLRVRAQRRVPVSDPRRAPPTPLQLLRTLQPPLFERYALTLDAASRGTLAGDPEPEQLHMSTCPIWRRTRSERSRCGPMRSCLRPAGYDANCFLVAPTYTHAAFFGMHRKPRGCGWYRTCSCTSTCSTIRRLGRAGGAGGHRGVALPFAIEGPTPQ